MSRAKSLLKNAKRIADCKTPDILQEPSQDILQRLKDYRASSVLKHSSPVKLGQKIMKIQGQAPSSRSYRPASSPYNEGMLGVKSSEKPTHRSNNLSRDLYYQEKSVERLYKGSRILADNLVQFSENKSEMLIQRTTSGEILEYMNSIRVLYPLRFDLELNYEVVKGDSKIDQHTMLGDYYSLKEKIDTLLNKSQDNIKDLSSKEFLAILQDYNRVLRHVLLNLKLNNHDDEATIIEMLWRVIIKLIDNALILHEQIVIDLSNKMREKVKKVTNEYQDKLNKLENESKAQIDDLEKKIQKLQETVKNLNSTILTKDKNIQERDERMNELMEGTNRDKSCIEMTRILKKLDAYISETEDQQHKQVAALSGISHVMSLAENFDNKPKSSVKNIQSDLSLPINPFPELTIPILSRNLFYSLQPAQKILDKERVLAYLNSCLDECGGDELFIDKLGVQLVEKIGVKSDLENVLSNIGRILLAPDCTKTRFFSRILGFPMKLYRPFELCLLKINQCLFGIDGKNNEGLLPLNKVIELFLSILPGHQVQVQNLISKLNYFIDFQIDLKLQTWVLICRFYYAFEKTKKPLKFHMEALDSKKEGVSKKYVVLSSTFVDWIKGKLNIWMKDSEISLLVNYFGGDLMRISTILERFSAAHIEKCKEVFVDKDEILLKLIENWENSQNSQIKHCGFFTRSQSIHE